jgi:DNA-directed RNA polymerase subunit RPC12/RpoP
MQPQQQQQQQQQYSASSYQQQQQQPQQLSFDDQPLRSHKPSAQPPMYPPGGSHGQYGGAGACVGGHAYGHGDDHDDQGDDDDDQGDEEEDDQDEPEQEDEMGGGDVDRMPCKVCGRKFVAASLARHMKVCEKVFVKKRKPMQVQRLSEEAQAELKELKRQNARNPRAKAASLLPPKDENAVPKWKIERAQLREALKAGREYTRAVAMGIDPPPMAAASAQADDRVLCPHCGRKFADMAAQRHIPKCATQRARPAPPPNRR